MFVAVNNRQLETFGRDMKLPRKQSPAAGITPFPKAWYGWTPIRRRGDSATDRRTFVGSFALATLAAARAVPTQIGQPRLH
jgi:hypothetical protein